MANLEKMLNEKDSKMSKIKSSIANDLVKEEEKYKAKVQDINCVGASDLASVEKRYSPRLTEALTQDLTHDYEAMKNRADCTGLTDEKIEEIAEIKEGLSKMRNKAAKESILKHLDKEMKDLLSIPSIEELANPVTITSYLAANGEGCYFLAPVIDETSNKFTKELTERILGVVKVGKVFEGKDPVYFKGKELEYINNFLMLNIETSHPNFVAKKLIEKFSDEHIQPVSFKEANMTHRVIGLDYNILKNFAGYADKPSKQESEIPAAKKKGRPFGSKNKKSIDDHVHGNDNLDFAHLNNIGNGEAAKDYSKFTVAEYDSLKAKYDTLTEKYGHAPTKTELNWNQRKFYDEIRLAEANGIKIDFIPYKRAPWGSKKKDKKKD